MSVMEKASLSTTSLLCKRPAPWNWSWVKSLSMLWRCPSLASWKKKKGLAHCMATHKLTTRHSTIQVRLRSRSFDSLMWWGVYSSNKTGIWTMWWAWTRPWFITRWRYASCQSLHFGCRLKTCHSCCYCDCVWPTCEVDGHNKGWVAGRGFFNVNKIMMTPLALFLHIISLN